MCAKGELGCVCVDNRVCVCVFVCVCGVASVRLAVSSCSCGAPPNTVEFNQPLHEYTRMESCAQLTGEIGAQLALLPSFLAPSCHASGQTPTRALALGQRRCNSAEAKEQQI